MASIDFDALIRKVQDVRDRAASDKDKLIAAYAKWDPATDGRITSFSKLVNVLNSLQLGFTFISKHLLNHTWWEDIAKEPISNSDRVIYATEFQNFVKVGFVQALFSSVCESSFRIFLRAIDPVACNRGTADFKSIYECLFKSKLTTLPADAANLLDLLRPVRNTIHNNGVYIAWDGRDAAVTYNGTTYPFHHGKAVDFVSWDLLLELADAVRQLLLAVIVDQAVSGVSGRIADPFAGR